MMDWRRRRIAFNVQLMFEQVFIERTFLFQEATFQKSIITVSYNSILYDFIGASCLAGTPSLFL